MSNLSPKPYPLNPVLYVVGPTASGKTALAIRLAKLLDGEIVCADSQTVRLEMNIGTAKPTLLEMEGIPHHCLDLVEPYEEFTLYQYQKLAKRAIEDIQARGKLPIVVGGTGLYVDALYFDFELPVIEQGEKAEEYSNLSVDELQQKIKSKGLELPKNDKNPRHLINVLLRAGRAGTQNKPSKDSIIIGLKPERSVLIDRINNRVEAMFDGGFVEEVRGIVSKYGRPPRNFDGIGYRIVMRFLDGEIDTDEAKELFKIADRQYAKRQMSWFKRNNNIEWFETPEKAYNHVKNTI
jgi:tRNA dimethylallyltransferase